MDATGWALAAGSLAGFVLGFLGAGGTVVGFPLLLYLARLDPHRALGTNALGVALVALAILAWRARDGRIPFGVAATFAAPGLVGIWIGARLGLLYPGRRLVVLLGALLFAVAGWMAYLSFRPAPGDGAPSAPSRPVPRPLSPRRAGALAAIALVVGAISGFFAIGGGFMTVPAIALIADLEIADAAEVALLPIAAFAGWVGLQYWSAGEASPALAAAMLPPGVAAGIGGVFLGRRASPRTTRRVFAAGLLILAAYMTLR